MFFIKQIKNIVRVSKEILYPWIYPWSTLTFKWEINGKSAKIAGKNKNSLKHDAKIPQKKPSNKIPSST